MGVGKAALPTIDIVTDLPSCHGFFSYLCI